MLADLYQGCAELAAAGWLPAAMGHEFMVRAALAAGIAAPLLGLLSPLVLSKRLAFLSEALGHATLTGVALGVLLGEPTDAAYGGLIGFTVAAALVITWVRLHVWLSSDAVVGVFLGLSLGLGVCLLAFATRRFDIHQIEALMFGNLVAIREEDLWLLAAAAAVILPPLVGQYNRMVLAGLDADVGRAWGVPVVLLEYVFTVALTVVVVVSLKLIGLLLVTGLVVIPAAAARLVSRSLRGWVLGSVTVALVSTQGGLMLSYSYPVPTGAAVILVLAAALVACGIGGGLRRRSDRRPRGTPRDD